MCRIQLRITHPVFGWWGLLIYSSVYDDALPYALRMMERAPDDV
jgi:hypothetical protein